MGLFDSVIDQAVALLQEDSGLSGYRILKAYPYSFHESPLSRAVVTVSFGGAKLTTAALGDYLGSRAAGELYGKAAEVELHFTLWTPLSLGGEEAWKAAAALCEALLFSQGGYSGVDCGEISYDVNAQALVIPCKGKRKLTFGKTGAGAAVSGVVVTGSLTKEKGVE